MKWYHVSITPGYQGVRGPQSEPLTSRPNKYALRLTALADSAYTSMPMR
jgi:hypothetical protein